MGLFSRVMTLGSGISLKVIHMFLVLELFNTILLFVAHALLHAVKNLFHVTSFFIGAIASYRVQSSAYLQIWMHSLTS